MAKILLLSSVGSRFAPVFASTAAHVAIFAAVAGGHAGAARTTTSESLVAVDLVPVAAPPSESPVLPPDPDDHHHAFHNHTHPYPVPFDHDAHPHDPSIDHRVALRVALATPPHANVLDEPLASAAGAVVAAAEDAAAEDAPHFSMVFGQGTMPYGAVTSGGGGTGAAPLQGEAAEADAPLPESGVSQRARLVSSVRPAYPLRAREAEAEADVTLEIVVDARGNVIDARVVRGAGLGFDDAARDAIRHYHFAPAERAGHAVSVRMQWAVQFRLQ